MQTAAETTEAAIVFTAPAVAAQVTVAAVSIAAAAVCKPLTRLQTWQVHTPPSDGILHVMDKR
jgi:hypothetical protein